MQLWLDPVLRTLILKEDFNSPTFEDMAYTALLTALTFGAVESMTASYTSDLDTMQTQNGVNELEAAYENFLTESGLDGQMHTGYDEQKEADFNARGEENREKENDSQGTSGRVLWDKTDRPYIGAPEGTAEFLDRVAGEQKETREKRCLRMTNETLRDVIAAIVEAADEIRAQEQRDAQDFGQLLAYAEALCIIRDACDVDDLAMLGLDFDIDKRYLL